MHDFCSIRKDFVLLNKSVEKNANLVWFDNASTTLKPNCVTEAVRRYYEDETSNSKRGGYDLGLKVDQVIDDTRKTVAKFLNCEPNEVIFTSGTTESLNIVANLMFENILCKGDEIIISEEEHASNALPWLRLQRHHGITVKVIKLNENGLITEEALKQVISNKTKVVSLAHVSNVMGHVLPIKRLAKIAHDNGALFIVDGAQSVPHIKVDFKDLDIDFLAFSGHKMLGPTGIGVLCGKYDLLQKLEPVKVGGGMNASFNSNGDYMYLDAPIKYEAGTLPIAGIYGLNEAIKYISKLGIENITRYEQELHSYAIEKMSDIDNIVIYNKNADTGIITFNIEDVEAEDLETYLNNYGICVRSGQHCAKMLNEYLKVNSTVRASLYIYNTKEEIDYFVDVLKKFDYDTYFTKLYGGAENE